MRTLMSALFTAAIFTGIALSPKHAGSGGASGATSLIRTASIDLTPDMSAPTPGPTDPNGPGYRDALDAREN